jgi:hypothetical protein
MALVQFLNRLKKTDWFIHRNLFMNWQSIYNAPILLHGHSSPSINGPRIIYNINSDFYKFDLLKDNRRDIYKLYII